MCINKRMHKQHICKIQRQQIKVAVVRSGTENVNMFRCELNLENQRKTQ